MARIALLVDLTFLLAGFVGRTWLQKQRTGDAGWRLGRPHSASELVARLLLVGAFVLIAASVVAGWDAATSSWSVAGIAVAALGVLVVVVAQLQMGASWRIGVDPAERTDLVQTGLYGRVRNPIYAGMVLFAIGQALMLPNGWSVAALVAMTIGVEIQVRAVEEPFLHTTHGTSFERWAAEAGRFAPGVGRLRSAD